MDEGPNPGGKRGTGGATGQFFAVWMKKKMADEGLAGFMAGDALRDRMHWELELEFQSS
jgi:hypothetical protein